MINYFSACIWSDIYDAIEFSYQWIPNRRTSELFEESINKILEEEKSGYRMINGQFTAITNEEEIQSVTESTNTQFDSVNTRMKKAIQLYSDHQNPDYENSKKVKE